MKAQRIEKAILYNEGTDKALDIGELSCYLEDKMSKVGVEVRESPFAFHPEKISDYARELASIKIQDATKKIVSEQEPLHGEVEYEKRRILGKTTSFGVLYDGTRLQRLFSELIPSSERSIRFIHIIISNRLFATWEDSDKRYHIRTSVYGFPSVLSTTGLIEAPAKPREYYLLKQQYEMLGRDLLELKDRFKGRFIDYGDERLTEAMKGYIMQAVFYSLTGNPFCEDKGCRLYNAHWQAELIFAQLESGYEFCQRHANFLKENDLG